MIYFFSTQFNNNSNKKIVQPIWVGLGWIFFFTHHGGLSQKIPSTRLMHTPNLFKKRLTNWYDYKNNSYHINDIIIIGKKFITIFKIIDCDYIYIWRIELKNSVFTSCLKPINTSSSIQWLVARVTYYNWCMIKIMFVIS